MDSPKEHIDLLSVGETLVDFISVEQTDWLRNAATFRRYLGGSPANIAVNVSKLGGSSAVISKTGIGAFGKFIKSELQRHGVSTDYLVMDHRNRTTVAFVSSTSGKPDFEIARSGDYQLKPAEITEEPISPRPGRTRLYLCPFPRTLPIRGTQGFTNGGRAKQDRILRPELQPAHLAAPQRSPQRDRRNVSIR